MLNTDTVTSIQNLNLPSGNYAWSPGTNHQDNCITVFRVPQPSSSNNPLHAHKVPFLSALGDIHLNLFLSNIATNPEISITSEALSVSNMWSTAGTAEIAEEVVRTMTGVVGQSLYKDGTVVDLLVRCSIYATAQDKHWIWCRTCLKKAMRYAN